MLLNLLHVDVFEQMMGKTGIFRGFVLILEWWISERGG